MPSEHYREHESSSGRELFRKIQEFEKCVLITGFGNVQIRDFDQFWRTIIREKPSNVEIQLFDAKFVATWQHLYFAALNALTAFNNRSNISKSLAMETILYASTQHQIAKAVKLIGIKTHSSEIAVLIIGDELETVRSALSTVSKHIKAKPEDTILEFSEEKREDIQETFEISSVELKTTMGKDDLEDTLKDLVIERMALLATQH